LAAGLLALLAALIGAYLLHKQTVQARLHEDERRRRRHEAVRATLPFALSQVSEYAEQVARCVEPLVNSTDESVDFHARKSLKLPNLPDEVLKHLTDAIEASPSARARSTMADMIRDLQILQSRSRSFLRDEPSMIVVRANVENLIALCAEVYAGTSILFGYARRQTECVKLSDFDNEARTALKLFGLFEEIHGRSFEALERALKNRPTRFKSRQG
jgi:hypothetical protein